MIGEVVKIKKVCNTCGATNNVVANGTYQWDYDTQGWVVNDLAHERPYCGECESEDVGDVTEGGE